MLSRLFRRFFLEARHGAFDAGHLHFGGSLHALTTRHAFVEHLTPARQTGWVVYAKPPFAGPPQVLDYVCRYTHRIAISNQWVLDTAEGHVRFRYKNYRRERPETHATMTLTPKEFIRRFLLHVLPPGFHRIRHYGFLGNRYRTEKLARCRQRLGSGTTHPAPDDAPPPLDYRARYEALTGISLRACPVCKGGHMILVEGLPRPAITDTSGFYDAHPSPHRGHTGARPASRTRCVSTLLHTPEGPVPRP